MQGKTAVVTGASSGIGAATAERFAAEGANVIVADIDADGAAQTVHRIEDQGGTARYVETDVTDSGQVEELVTTAVETYGSLDIAHNNAGVGGDYVSTVEQSEENWDLVVDSNLKGVWLCLKYEIPVMMEGEGGAIVNTSSIAGSTASGTAPYVATKHGINGLTRVAATEYAAEGIRVNAVSPGVIDTPLAERSREANPEALEEVIAMHSLNRMGTPDEVANAVVWLASEEASFVTGSTYPVDGGYLAV